MEFFPYLPHINLRYDVITCPKSPIIKIINITPLKCTYKVSWMDNSTYKGCNKVFLNIPLKCTYYLI